MKQIWEVIISELSKNYPKPLFDWLILPLNPHSLTNNILTIIAPDETVRTNFNTHILETATTIFQKYYPNHTIKLILENDIISTTTNESNEQINQYKNSQLNSQFSFDNFVVGPGNQMAHAAALAVSESPGTTYNPLFFYGGVGLGKTHLMHAIGNAIYSKNKNANIICVSSETFTNDFISSLQNTVEKNKPIEQFKNKYRNADLLLVDDVQFLAGKESTLVEFFHTFNALYESNKQIVLTSDRVPEEIPDLPNRLVSRFKSGLMTDITPPDLETRTAILRNKAISENLMISDETLSYIAGQVNSNVRDLTGALKRVSFYATMTKREITPNLASEALLNTVTNTNDKIISIYDIQMAVSKMFHITIEQLKGSKRNKEFVIPRQIAMYLCRELTDKSLPKIGDEFGGKNHTTVMHAYDKIYQKIQKNEDINLLNQIEKLKKSLK